MQLLATTTVKKIYKENYYCEENLQRIFFTAVRKLTNKNVSKKLDQNQIYKQKTQRSGYDHHHACDCHYSTVKKIYN